MSTEYYERLRRRKAEAEREKEVEEWTFWDTIQKGQYPEKCMECFELGVRNCRWWEENFECEKHGLEVAREKLKYI